MQFLTKAKLATAVVGIALGATACGIHGTGHQGSIAPVGTSHGTFPYCSYTPTSSGISISHYEHAPCLVTDTRTSKERQHSTPSPSHTATVPWNPSVTPTHPPTTPAPTRTTPGPTPTFSSMAKTLTTKGPKISLAKAPKSPAKH